MCELCIIGLQSLALCIMQQHNLFQQANTCISWLQHLAGSKALIIFSMSFVSKIMEDSFDFCGNLWLLFKGTVK